MLKLEGFQHAVSLDLNVGLKPNCNAGEFSANYYNKRGEWIFVEIRGLATRCIVLW
jgi:hypothetical protein